MTTPPVVPVPAHTCPPCRAGVTSQRDVLAYKRIFIHLARCFRHLAMWDAASERANAREARQ